MIIKYKKLSLRATAPLRSKEGDAGFDITAISQQVDQLGRIVYSTGLAFEIPMGYVGLLFPRSSISNTGLSLTNCVGVIDSGYRGEVMAKFRKVDDSGIYAVGDRIIQMLIIKLPDVEMEEVSELSDSDRGIGGFGSTGR